MQTPQKAFLFFIFFTVIRIFVFSQEEGDAEIPDDTVSLVENLEEPLPLENQEESLENQDESVRILYMRFNGGDGTDADDICSAMREELIWMTRVSGYTIVPSVNILTEDPQFDMLAPEDQEKNPQYLINGTIFADGDVWVTEITLWNFESDPPALIYSQSFEFLTAADIMTMIPFYSWSLYAILPILEEEENNEDMWLVRTEAQNSADAAVVGTTPAAPLFTSGLFFNSGFRAFYPGPEGVLSNNIRLKNDYYPIGSLFFTGKFSNNLGFVLGFDRDSILMNRIMTRVAWNISFIGLEAGPYLGLLNTDSSHVVLGLSLRLRLGVPQWGLSASFMLDTPLGRELSGPGDYNQSFSEISIGYAPSIFQFTLSMTNRGSAIKNAQDISVMNDWVRYNFAMGITLPPRNIWGLRFNVGYQELHWTYNYNYSSTLPALKYPYSSVYAGLGASYTINSSITLSLGLEMPVYPFVYLDIQSISDPQAPFFGEITFGFHWITELYY